MVVFLLVLAPMLMPASGQQSTRFDAELNEAASQTAAIISKPPESSWIEGPRLTEFREALWLASIWPHPILRQPLRALLNHADPGFVGSAARGVLAFDDANGIADVQRLLHDERTIVAGCFGYSLAGRVQESIAEREMAVTFLPADVEHGIPLTATESWRLIPVVDDTASNAMTIADATRIMRETLGPTRWQAFYWLARRGIVLEVEPLIEAWEHAGEDIRPSLLADLRLAGKYVGRERLRAALEQLASELDPRDLSVVNNANIAAGLAAVESRMTLTFAFPVVDECGQIETEPPSYPYDVSVEERALVQALDAVADIASDEDLCSALLWTSSPNFSVRRAAMSILSRIDHPTATECVLSLMRSDERLNVMFAPSVLRSISSRPRCDNGVCWSYVSAVNERMQRVATQIGDDKGWNSLTSELDALIHALEGLTEVNNGSDSFTSPGFDSQIGVSTARKWGEWISAADAGGVAHPFFPTQPGAWHGPRDSMAMPGTRTMPAH